MSWQVVELPLDRIIKFRVQKAEKERFIKWCEIRGTDPSKELRKFIQNTTK